MKSLSVIVKCWQKCGVFCKLSRKSKGRVLNIGKKIINTLNALKFRCWCERKISFLGHFSLTVAHNDIINAAGHICVGKRGSNVTKLI